SALAWWGSTLVVAHRFDPRLMLVKPGGAVEPVPAVASAEGVVADRLGVAFVAEHARDTVLSLDLAAGGRVRWRREVEPNPKALALAGDLLAVGSLQTGEVEVLSRDTGAPGGRIAPRPGTPIQGGGTEAFSEFVIGGKAVRALAFAGGRLLSANLGPNVGPNPRRMEVTANGGVSELDVQAGKVLRHRGFGAGVTSGLAADEGQGLLYAADPALGRVRVLDLRTLEVKQEISIPPPERFPRIRSAADLGTSGRAGDELHSGPCAVALDAPRRRLWALDRFTGTAAEIDVSKAAAGQAAVVKQWPLVDALSQPKRRLGQVLYFADVGRTSMSCDACHLEGHTEGVFFEKTFPLRIYRATTVRGSRETPPYFTPASTSSLSQTASEVGGRNRFHNPDPTPAEVEALALYSASLATLPNPFVGADGAPVEGELELFDHQRGRPREGLKLFEAHCLQCHPPPHFTTDQDPATRGKYLDVGTPEVLPLREGMQDVVHQGMAPPSLLGAWDIFPMLSSGSAGLKVVDGERLEVGARFALREVIELYGGPRHGGSAALTAQERNDLLAYLLSL
ncbi:MAG TPA: MtsA protein, partial [Myxococcales bacterium]|nr:MtsA protein [Myxococcales bacterium]